ncbi:toll/interleukin-1 receptor domain-containing protein [Rufibacter aurantiacus]|uniref:toll/interleukin-1 receptor domain-containing protein n=1 Tax=Rufibacter aurantiacus TaxID=2817374 RepID=UPI001B311837|nr:toll/interleukin-1 receptor domain-containing protein [Rufibacter aurantiacus]
MIDDIRLAILNNDSIVPVFGFELLPIRKDGVLVPYLDYLSKHIAESEEHDIPQDDHGFGLFNHVIHKLLVSNRYNKLDTIKKLSQYAIEIHDLVDRSYLEKVVSVSRFKYFFNLTFTTHLSEVVSTRRAFPNIEVKQSMFPFVLKNPKKPEDLIKNECSYEGVVYNLFGLAYKRSRNYERLFNFFYSDDDILEFIPEFNRRFEIDLINYKEVVSQSSLLFLGCQYPDWLIRVLIHTLKPGSLGFGAPLQARVFFDYCNDITNSFFLDKHSFKFQSNHQTLEIVDELHEVLLGDQAVIDVRSDSFVFVSYTRENSLLVKRIVCQLANRMNIWFDKIKLFPGDSINEEIKEGIRNCKLFLPVITEESVRRGPDAYVRQEWIYYRDNFRGNPKVVPIVSNRVNLGVLGLSLDNEFATLGANLLYVVMDDNGISEGDINIIGRRL